MNRLVQILCFIGGKIRLLKNKAIHPTAAMYIKR